MRCLTRSSKRSQGRRTTRLIAGGLQALLIANSHPQVVAFSSKQVEKTIVLLYNKPANVVTTHNNSGDSKERATVYDDINRMRGFVSSANSPVPVSNTDGNGNMLPVPSFEQVTGMYRKLHAVGRLDAETTGLLLLTNDGGLVHHVTNSHAISQNANCLQPKRSPLKVVTKTYEALIMGYHEQQHQQLDDPSKESPSRILNTLSTQHVDIGAKYGGLCQPVQDLVVLDHPTPKSTLVQLTISEGKNRQIRRMFHALGSGVMKLKRVRIGPHLTLEGIEREGQWRLLSNSEVETSLDWKPRVLPPEYSTNNNNNRNNQKHKTNSGNNHTKAPRRKRQRTKQATELKVNKQRQR